MIERIKRQAGDRLVLMGIIKSHHLEAIPARLYFFTVGNQRFAKGLNDRFSGPPQDPLRQEHGSGFQRQPERRWKNISVVPGSCSFPSGAVVYNALTEPLAGIRTLI
jgi:hypothetical protein